MPSVPSLPPVVPATSRPIRMVAIGDSLTAGMQDANLDSRTQSMAFSNQLARQAGIEFNMPYVDQLGIPPRLFNGPDVDLGRTILNYALIGAASAAPIACVTMGFVPPDMLMNPLYHAGEMGERRPDSKDTPEHVQTNFGVPGFEIRHIAGVGHVSDHMTEMCNRTVRSFQLPVLEPLIHAILQNGTDEARGDEVSQAIKTQPDLVVLWPGSNDALETVTGGVVDDRVLTPMVDQQWTYWKKNKLTGNWSQKTTTTVQPGFRTSLMNIIERLEQNTNAEVLLCNVPDVTVVPFLLTVGEKVGPLPFRIVLPDGTDVTSFIENWVIPNGVEGDGKDGRTEFPPGTRVGLGKLLKSITDIAEVDNLEQFQERMALLDRGAVFSEFDVLDPDELAAISARIREFNDLMREVAENNPRVHLVDMNTVLSEARQNGIELEGPGEAVKLTTTFCGLQDPRGYGGFFSYDGIHPSDIGYSVVANELLRTIQRDLGSQEKFAHFLNVPLIDEKAVYAADPHRQAGQLRLILNRDSVERLNQGSAFHAGRGQEDLDVD